MSAESAKVRIGMTSARELELDVTDADKVATDLEAALSSGDALVWITDSRGHRYGIVTAKLAFVHIELTETRPGVGFAPGE